MTVVFGILQIIKARSSSSRISSICSKSSFAPSGDAGDLALRPKALRYRWPLVLFAAAAPTANRQACFDRYAIDPGRVLAQAANLARCRNNRRQTSCEHRPRLVRARASDNKFATRASGSGAAILRTPTRPNPRGRRFGPVLRHCLGIPRHEAEFVPGIKGAELPVPER